MSASPSEPTMGRRTCPRCLVTTFLAGDGVRSRAAGADEGVRICLPCSLDEVYYVQPPRPSAWPIRLLDLTRANLVELERMIDDGIALGLMAERSVRRPGEPLS